MKHVKLYSLLLMITVISACNGDNQKQKTSAIEAIKSLKKIEAATQVGMNKAKYSDLLIEAKTAVNQAKGVLPDNELKKELDSAMNCYVDAGIFWDGKVISHDGKNIGKKYFKEEIDEDLLKLDTKSELKDLYLQGMWVKAKEHLEKANKLAEK